MDWASLMQMFGNNGSAPMQLPWQTPPGAAAGPQLPWQQAMPSTSGAAGANPMTSLGLMSMIGGGGDKQQAQIGAPGLRGMPGALPRTKELAASPYTNMNQNPYGQVQAVNPYASAISPMRMRMPLGLMNFLGR